jgi:hypothetical protein
MNQSKIMPNLNEQQKANHHVKELSMNQKEMFQTESRMMASDRKILPYLQENKMNSE